MIILPAISGLIGFLGALLEPILIGAGLAALISSSVSVVGDTIKYREDGISREEQSTMVENAGNAAVEGALFSVPFSLAGFVMAPAIAPAITAVDDVGTQVIGAADDAAKTVANTGDDAANAAKSRSLRSGAAAVNIVDDGACRLLCRLGKSAKSLPGRVSSVVNRARNGWNARIYRSLPAANATERYVYVMDDSANGLHKIGMTTRKPELRLAEVSRDAKSKVNFVCIIRTDRGSGLESLLKNLFKRQNTSHPMYDGTEWFKLTGGQVSTACGF